MSKSLEQFHRGVIDGSDHRISASLLRGCLSLAEPIYAIATVARNRMFDSGSVASHRAGRPVISVGNITTGGTGKTPVVRWLVETLRAAGHAPAVLMRGYKASADEDSDEQRLLESQLPGTAVEANPSRVDGASRVLAAHPEVNVFVLDDGFQHRRLHRDLDIVLVDATNPFGFDHVLPRGLLREPLEGLGRASAFIITHCELATAARLSEITSVLHKFNAVAPVYRCSHVQVGLRYADDALMDLTALAGSSIFAFCGLGNPAGFQSQLEKNGAKICGSMWFADHHAYTASDLADLQNLAEKSGAKMLVTSEKDWVKIEPLLDAALSRLPIWRTELSLRFREGDDGSLRSQVLKTLPVYT